MPNKHFIYAAASLGIAVALFTMMPLVYMPILIALTTIAITFQLGGWFSALMGFIAIGIMALAFFVAVEILNLIGRRQ